MEESKIQVPEKFRNIISDFITDISTTFPDYSHLWFKWGSPDISEEELTTLFEYLLTVYPERFFDILYQNEDIFKDENTINVHFLPNVDFKLLYNCKDITENTKKALWKYLQIILFTITGSVQNKSIFGNTANMFDGIDETELQEKLEETMKGITQFFSQFEKEFDKPSNNNNNNNNNNKEDETFNKDDEKETDEHFKPDFEIPPNMEEQFKNTFNFENMKGMPKPEEIHEHLKGLFDGKIGKLAKEMAEEISEDMGNLFGDEKDDIRTSQDVLKKLMKDPRKMMDLVKLVGTKLNSKMQSGEISQEEIMKEASELINKMKGSGMGGKGGEDFGEMLKKLTKQMGGLGGLAKMGGMEGLGGLGDLANLGKHAKVDTNAMNNMFKKQSFKEKMRERYEKKKQLQMVSEALLANQKQDNVSLEQKDSNNFVFKIGNEVQEKSSRKPSEIANEVDAIMKDLELTDEVVSKPTHENHNKKKKKGKK